MTRLLVVSEASQTDWRCIVLFSNLYGKETFSLNFRNVMFDWVNDNTSIVILVKPFREWSLLGFAEMRKVKIHTLKSSLTEIRNR